MFGFYTPILILQSLCIYHAYRNNSEQKWYWLIIFFPAIGCLIYLYHHFYSRQNISSLAEGVKVVINSNYKIERLEKELKFADTVVNKSRLADEYVKVGRYSEAINLYADCLKGFMADDPHLMIKLVHAHYLNSEFEQAVQVGDKLKTEKLFRDAIERIGYALALAQVGQKVRAEEMFIDMDRPFTNYEHRIAYSRFLIEEGRVEESKTKLLELLDEFNHMEKMERRQKSDLVQEIKNLLGSLQKN